MASLCGHYVAGCFVRHSTDDDASREREAYRYFQPLQDLQHADDSQSTSPDPHSSRDRALTAFAQLGALRLGARRAFVSLLDRQYQYILAEATKTLSLQKDTVHDDKDDLWAGACKFPRNSTPCEYAAGLLEVPELLSSENKGDVIVFPDLAEHVLFNGHALVTERPHGRFYAGVPIISPNGYNIGVYCVLDDAPRDGLSRVEIDFMKDMAATVMSHLEMVRATAELNRSHNMVQGLGTFLDGKANLKQWWRNVSHDQTQHPDPSVEPEHPKSPLPPPKPSSTRQHSRQSAVKRVKSLTIRPSPGFGSMSAAALKRASMSNASTLPGRSPTSPKTVREPPSDGTNLQEESISSDVRSTFQRAADIIRESVDVDGALFLDASVGTFGGLVDTLRGRTRKNSPTGTSNTGSVTSTMTDESFPKSPSAVEKPCIVLGRSLLTASRMTHSEAPEPSLSVSECFLQKLLAKYPKGKIWTFDQSEDDSYDKHDDIGDITQTADFVNRKGERWRERKMIRTLFPTVRSLALVGLWDPHRSRFYAGSILWTCSPTRILYPENELNYMVAFGQSIMAEVARIDVKMADKAKATFISSISHELRTPLHGVMGGAECLQSTNLDALQYSLISTIETCGRTLLDTFDNLLSFAKINNLMNSSNYRRPSTPSSVKVDSPRTPAKSADVPVDLSVLVEEVVETAFAGHEFVRLSPIRNSLAMGGMDASNNVSFNAPRGFDSINVILDYDTAQDWVFLTQSGAWIRVIMNLVGNSLKYTEKGNVTVRLDATPLPDPESKDEEVEVRLTVTDTGKGMTDEFLRSSVFSPFVQEDPLSPGTGLGLSIVKQIITQMGGGGTISIQSKKNEGTEIEVVVCMARAKMPIDSSKPSIIPGVSELFRDRHVNLIGPQDETENAFTKLCKRWLGITIHSSAEAEEADVYVITETQARVLAQHLASLPEDQNILADKPVVVLCKDLVSARALKSSNATTSISSWVEYMSQPYGPNKVAKTLALCCDRQAETMSLFSRRSSRAASPVGSIPSRPGFNRIGSGMSGMSAFRQSSNPNIVLYTPIDEVSQPSLVRQARKSIEFHETPPLTPTALAATQQSLGGMSVLLVDDNTINLNLLTTFIKKQKLEFGTAMNGLEALNAYSAAATTASLPSGSPPSKSHHRRPSAYDFVFMDINMPVMDGLEATRQIRALERGLGLRPATIVALTGMASASAQQEAFASGVDLFLTKPVRLKELTRVLDGRT